MKVLIVNTSDIQGGAGRAAYRLHRALLDSGVNSQMLVQSKASDDFTVLSEANKVKYRFQKLKPLLDSLVVLKYRNKTSTLFSPSILPFSDVIEKINEIKPDIVHLHWICGGMLRIENINRIKAPVVWSLHDMWAFTGGCHYDEGCGGYVSSCGSCKVLSSNKPRDLSSRVFQRKNNTFSKKEINIIGLSSWINDCSQQSFLFKDKEHTHLPNLIDSTLFKPYDKQQARCLWNLPNDKKLILFGAMSATSDPRKGFKELSAALGLLNTEDVELVIFGSSEPKESPSLRFKTHYLGHLHDDVSLVMLYSAVDIMVVPSIQENLSNAIMESLACATPVVSFDVGGNGDMIDHQVNGYLAKPFDISDLANGIDWILQNKNYSELCFYARSKVERCFESKVVVKKYIRLYQKLISTSKS